MKNRCETVVKIGRIKIPRYYSRPRMEKLLECQRYFNEHHELDREIVVDRDLTLKDGYVGYLVLLANNVEDVKVVSDGTINQNYKTLPTKYVFARHAPMMRQYVWRIAHSTSNVENLHVGGRVLVNTKHGNKVVTVMDVKTLDKPPVMGRIKKVIKCFAD